jgi:hypothetical protein
MDNRGQSILRIYLGVTFGPLSFIFFFGMQIFWYPDVV